MDIAVVVTTYNNPSSLERVLEALRHQTRLPDEVVVADDGSGEETRSVVAAFCAAAPFRVEHAWQENEGFRAAGVRNLGIRQTRAHYIVCLDGDCLPARCFVEDHQRLAEPGCFFNGKRVYLDRHVSKSFDYRDANTARTLFRLLLQGHITRAKHLARLSYLPAVRSRRLGGIKSSNLAFFRQDIVAVNGFNEDFVGWGREDSELGARFIAYGLKRKQHRFMALCFHLWHESETKNRVPENDHLLQRAIESGEYFCTNGLSQRDSARLTPGEAQ